MCVSFLDGILQAPLEGLDGADGNSGSWEHIETVDQTQDGSLEHFWGGAVNRVTELTVVLGGR